MIRNEEYEKAYCDAREVLYNRGKKISGPVRRVGGVRYCSVDGFLLTDRDLLIEAWGESLADEIIVELTVRDSPAVCSQECDRLWRQYSDVTRRNLQILIQRQVAASRQDAIAVAQLAQAIWRVGECRRQIRQSLLDLAGAHTCCGA